jgi:hypothetical protein
MMLAVTLLGAAATIFVFASSLLTFHGWPQLNGYSDSRPLIVTSAAAAAPRVPVLAFAPAPPRAATRRVAVTNGSVGPVHRYAGVPGSDNMTAPLPAPKTPTPSYSDNSGSAHQPTPQSPPPGSTSPGNDGAAIDVVGTVNQTVGQTGSLLGNTTQGATAAVGSNVAAVTSTAGRVVGVVSPPLGQTVAGVGDAVDSTVTGVGKLVGGLLGGATQGTPATP